MNTQALKESKYNSFREYPHLEARLRQRVQPTEATLALDALLRRDEMEPEARLKLFRRLADHFRSLVKFDEKVNDMITDEQYVRNAVASIYRQNNFRKTPIVTNPTVVDVMAPKVEAAGVESSLRFREFAFTCVTTAQDSVLSLLVFLYLIAE